MATSNAATVTIRSDGDVMMSDAEAYEFWVEQYPLAGRNAPKAFRGLGLRDGNYPATDTAVWSKEGIGSPVTRAYSTSGSMSAPLGQQMVPTSGLTCTWTK